MPVKAFEVPKYAQIVTAVQERITGGVYAHGAMIPSESALMAEFNTSRPTVVRALSILEQDGWLEAVHGRGRFVRRTSGRDDHTAGAGRPVLASERSAKTQVLSAGVVAAPIRAASALGLAEGAPAWARRRLVGSPVGPLQLSTVYTLWELADGTDLAKDKPMAGDLIDHLTARKGVSFDYATDRISARPATTEESGLLDIGRRDPVLTVLVTCFDSSGGARLVVDVVAVASRVDLEDSFPLA